MLSGKGLYLFTLRKIPVKLDPSWFLIFFLLIFSLGSYLFPELYPEVGPVERWIISVMGALFLFVSVLIHEFAHAVVAQNRGIRIVRIMLFIFGGLAQMSKDPEDARSEFLISGAGPLASLFLGGLFLSAALALEGFVTQGVYLVLWYTGYVNFLLVIFNMVPGFPLDGGRMLRALIWQRTGNLRKATRVVSRIGQGFAWLLMFFGVIWLLNGQLIQGVFWIFIGIFLLQSATRGYQMVAFREGLSGVSVEQFMTENPVTVPPDISLRKLVDDYFMRRRYAAFPVKNDQDMLLGMIEINQVKSHPNEEWDRLTVQDVMTPTNRMYLAGPQTDAFDVLTVMITHQLGRVLVVSGNRLLGIVSRKDILQFVEMRAELDL